MMSTANAQTKSGILKKDNYGDFSADKWEEFLAGQNAAEFEKKSNIKLQDYQVIIEDFVKTKLGEPNTAAAVANSEKVSFPAGADIYTAASDGKTWITRKTYLNETGFYHTPTGIYWLSFKCGNLCLVKDGKVSASDLTLKTPQLPPPTVTNPNGINITVNGQQAGQELSWTTGYAVYSQGRNDRQNDFVVDASLFKMIQDSKQCCGATQQPAMQNAGWVMSGQPMMMQASMPAQQVVQQKVPFGQTFGGQLLANTIGVFVGNELSQGFNLFGGNQQYARGQYCAHGNQIGFCQICNGGFQNFGPGFQWNNGGGGGYTDYSGGPIHPASGDRFSSGIASSSQLIPGAGSGYGYNNNFGTGFLYR